MVITPIFVGVLLLIQIPLTIMVGYRRLKTDIRFLAGDDTVLLRRMRAHGNFTETVPITLIAMGYAELLAMPFWLLLVGGMLLVGGRLIHIATILTAGWGPGRSGGMVMTFLAMFEFAVWCLGASLV